MSSRNVQNTKGKLADIPESPLKNDGNSSNFLDFSNKNVQDVTFSLAGFLTILIILTHYAWIMRQLVLYRDISTLKIAIYFLVLALNISGLLYLLVKVIYKKVYGEEGNEKKNQ